MSKLSNFKIKWTKSVEKLLENGGRLGPLRQDLHPPPPPHTHTKTICWIRLYCHLWLYLWPYYTACRYVNIPVRGFQCSVFTAPGEVATPPHAGIPVSVQGSPGLTTHRSRLPAPWKASTTRPCCRRSAWDQAPPVATVDARVHS